MAHRLLPYYFNNVHIIDIIHDYMNGTITALKEKMDLSQRLECGGKEHNSFEHLLQVNIGNKFKKLHKGGVLFLKHQKYEE